MDSALASTILHARRAAGLTQAELARRAGISASYLSRIEGAAWERGGPWPADGVLRALARTLALSSTELVAMRRVAQAGQAGSRPVGYLTGAGGRMPYSVSVGTDSVESAARGLIARNPGRGTLRSVQVFQLEAAAGCEADRPEARSSYVDALDSAMAARPESILYRVSASDRRHLPLARVVAERATGGRPPARAGNVRSRIAFCNPLVLDVLVGDHEVLMAVPDRRGHPYLRAGVVVDDPDFVAAVREWFDESVWDPPCEHADIRGDTLDEALAGIEARAGG